MLHGGGPAADPARGRRGAPGRHRAFHLRHRPQQGGDRGPFRPAVRARSDAAASAARTPTSTLLMRDLPAPGSDELHPPAVAAGPGPCGVVRARAGRPRAVRAAAARRAGAAQARLPGADDRGRARPRRDAQRDRGRGSAAGASPQYGVVGVGKAQGQGVRDHRDGREAASARRRRRTSCITGRYILQPEIFDILGEQERGAGGEIQLTDAMIDARRRRSRSTA